ncbi:MurR/RpiR family transcriptional regulator [Companilactobacillus kimchii]|uniref:MurR/RpiR family transcriptional regulator n=1 Tax=Companilactobacillus kimchii TaxID=2801452 RepID=UPI0006D164CB|nr:MurR/RpiR family transcriptional regulator [Companilactobacillus kimchii]
MKYSKFKNINNLTDNEQQVLDFLMENNTKVLNLGVRGVAKANFTSTSTVMRLAQKLGYSGFVEMHYKIAEYLNKPSDKIDRSAEAQSILSKTPNSFLENFANIINKQDDNYIYIYATGFSATAAEYIYKKLLMLGKKCLISTGGDSIGVFENNLNNISTLIVISKSGETQQVIDKVKMASDENIEVLSITGSNDNTINYLSSLPIVCKDDYPTDDYNQFSNNFFPNVFVCI